MVDVNLLWWSFHNKYHTKLFFFLSKLYAQREPRTQDPQIKSRMLYQLSQPGATQIFMLYILN